MPKKSTLQAVPKESEAEQNIERMPVSEVVEYRPIYDLIAQAEKQNSSLVFAYDTPNGNKEARSHIHSLRGVRGKLEAARKDAKANIIKIGKAIDKEATELDARILGMIEHYSKPLEEIERKEEERKDRLRRMVQSFSYVPGMDSAGLRLEIERLHLADIGDEYQEFQAEAIATRNQTLQRYRDEIVPVEKREAEAAELAKLRAEAAERQREAEAAELAKLRAEAAERQREAEAAELAKLRAEAAERQRQANAQAELERREREAILAQERAAAAVAEAKRREADLEARHAIEKAQAAERAATAEKQRQEAAKAAEQAENERREKDVAHRRKINLEAVDSGVALGWDEKATKGIIEAIAKGKIKNVTINY